jgi:GntR family transcriptional repressor for pyruvate dehydrogenase complex
LWLESLTSSNGSLVGQNFKLEECVTDLKLIPQRRERLGDQLYGQILEQIVSGALTAGDKLPSENQICRSFQVSRPTVREALMRLHADGLVTTRQGSGTFVQKRPSDQLTRLTKVSDIAGMLRCFEVRIALEGQAASLAATRRTPAQMDSIFAALNALQLSFEGASTPSRLDFEFHLAVAKASGNGLFADLLEMLNDTIQHGMAVALDMTRAGSKERGRRVVEEHEAIAEAIARGDSETASLNMKYHLHRARQRLTDGQRDK